MGPDYTINKKTRYPESWNVKVTSLLFQKGDSREGSVRVSDTVAKHNWVTMKRWTTYRPDIMVPTKTLYTTKGHPTVPVDGVRKTPLKPWF